MTASLDLTQSDEEMKLKLEGDLVVTTKQCPEEPVHLLKELTEVLLAKFMEMVEEDEEEEEAFTIEEDFRREKKLVETPEAEILEDEVEEVEEVDEVEEEKEVGH